MPITFSCDNCHSSFTVDSQLAGRSAKCRKCGQRMVIPTSAPAQRPALAGAGKMAGGQTSPSGRQTGTATAGRKSGVGAAHALQQSSGAATARPIGWLDAVNSQVGLKPVTIMATRPVSRKEQQEIDEFEDPRSQYKVVVPREMRKKSAIVTKPGEIAWGTYLQGIRSYRQFFNVFAVLFRRINEIAYGVSLIFVNVAIVGAIMSNHSLVVLGISLVVLLNLIQLAAGVSNLIAIQFRGNVVQGLLFLFPPVTAYYLWKNWNRWNKAIKRITGPIIWLVIVTAAYSYIPWLNGSKTGKTNWKDAVESIKKDVSGTMSDLQKKASELEEKIPELDKAKLYEFKKKAGETVDDLKGKAEKAIDGARSNEKPDSGGAAEPAPGKNP